MSKDDNTPVEKLFGSKTRAKLLELFFSDMNKSYYVREMTRVIGEQINSVRRELINLESIGIVKNETYDNKIYYSANMKHPFSHALSEMFGPKKVITGVSTNNSSSVEVRRIRTNWNEYIRPVAKYLKALVVTNRLPGQDGIDMLIVGDDRTKKLTGWAEVVEKKQGRPMNYVIMSRDDYLYRKSVRDRFITELLDMEISELFDPEKMIK